jgi:hypothetical protein
MIGPPSSLFRTRVFQWYADAPGGFIVVLSVDLVNTIDQLTVGLSVSYSSTMSRTCEYCELAPSIQERSIPRNPRSGVLSGQCSLPPANWSPNTKTGTFAVSACRFVDDWLTLCAEMGLTCFYSANWVNLTYHPVPAYPYIRFTVS